MNTHPQLPLALALRESARFNSYFAGANTEAVLALQQAACGAGESLVYIAAGHGLGKTHLLQAACVEAGACGRSSSYLPIGDLLAYAPAVFEGHEQYDLLCVDDVTALAGLDDWERGLFDLFNRVRAAGHTLLVAGDRRADRAGFHLPDLASRLGWGLTYRLSTLDETELGAALACRAQARGLELPEETGQYLLKRYPRDLATLFALFEQLDTASIVEQRRLTVPFVRAVLDRTGAG